MLPIMIDALSLGAASGGKGTGAMSGAGLAADGAGEGFMSLFGIVLGEGIKDPQDLRAKLQQLLPPEMLQQLEAAIAGGMSLPEVANQIRPQLQQLDADRMRALERLLQLQPSGAQERASVIIPDELTLPKAAPNGAAEDGEHVDLLSTGRLRDLFDSLRLAAEGVTREGGRATRAAEMAQMLTATGSESSAGPKLAQLEALPQGVLQTLQRHLSVAPDRHLQVPLRMGDAGWGQALADRVAWLVGRGQQVAELRLNPPNLGPLEVKISMQQDQASVTFVSQHGAVRDAVEAALPRLREMFGQQDLQLVQVDVGQGEAGAGRSRAGSDSAGRDDAANNGRGDVDGAEEAAEGVPDAGIPLGLLDLYA